MNAWNRLGDFRLHLLFHSILLVLPLFMVVRLYVCSANAIFACSNALLESTEREFFQKAERSALYVLLGNPNMSYNADLSAFENSEKIGKNDLTGGLYPSL